MSEVQTLPWYKEKWVWLLIGIPLSSILFGIFMLTMAVSGRDSLVRDDYYKDGLMINEELQRDQKAADLGLSAQVRLVDEHLELTLRKDGQPYTPDGLLALRLLHPTLADSDNEIMLVPNGDHYLATAPSDLKGRRYLQLSDQEKVWRLKGESWFPASHTITLEPSVRSENE